MRLLTILMLAALVGGVPLHAQTAPADTTAPRVVMRQGAAPAGVSGVRQRIQAIRGQQGRVVQPIIVVVPAPAPQVVVMPGAEGNRSVPPPALAAPLTPSERSALDRIRPGLGRQLEDTYTFYQPPGTVVTMPGTGATTPGQAGITRVDTVYVRDTVTVNPSGITPPGRGNVPALPPANVAQMPTVREVERAILETGLFRAVGVNFEFDKSTLLDGAGALIDPVGEVLRKYPDLNVEVGGHTDNIGSDAYNQKLSQDRAETVRQYLIEKYALDPSRLVARGYGESQPFVTNQNPTGRTLNRRVEFKVLPAE